MPGVDALRRPGSSNSWKYHSITEVLKSDRGAMTTSGSSHFHLARKTSNRGLGSGCLVSKVFAHIEEHSKKYSDVERHSDR